MVPDLRRVVVDAASGRFLDDGFEFKGFVFSALDQIVQVSNVGLMVLGVVVFEGLLGHVRNQGVHGKWQLWQLMFHHFSLRCFTQVVLFSGSLLWHVRFGIFIAYRADNCLRTTTVETDSDPVVWFQRLAVPQDYAPFIGDNAISPRQYGVRVKMGKAGRDAGKITGFVEQAFLPFTAKFRCERLKPPSDPACIRADQQKPSGQGGKGVATARTGLRQAIVKATLQIDQFVALLREALRRMQQTTRQAVEVLATLFDVSPRLAAKGEPVV